VYAAFRDGLRLLGLDAENYGSPGWNPLGSLAGPGDRVLLKPNAVLDRNLSGGDPFAVITHPSVMRAVLDYVYIALRGKGSVVIADAPQFDSDFDAWLSVTRLDSLKAFYREAAGMEIGVLDLRRLVARFDPGRGIYSAEDLETRNGDPLGYVVVDLGRDSLLSGLEHLDRLYGADYDCGFTREHHSGGRHEYCISGTVLRSDLLISLPKLKTHRKVGVTLGIKGLVGINGDKNYLAHYRVGPPCSGGDEYPDSVGTLRKASRASRRRMSDALLAPRKPALEKAYVLLSRMRRGVGRIARLLGLLGPPSEAEAIDCGDWHGNDTAWRMAADLLRIALYATPEGALQAGRARRLLSVIDGVVGGEGEGPLSASPRRDGVLVIGSDPVAVDIAASEYMGLSHLAVPMLRHFSEGLSPWSGYPGDAAVRVLSPGSSRELPLDGFARAERPFRLPAGWCSVRPGEQPGGQEGEGSVHQQE
jgi:uncharacterized protein (DUF362 family)